MLKRMERPDEQDTIELADEAEQPPIAQRQIVGS
jgi:hypothetical protein